MSNPLLTGLAQIPTPMPIPSAPGGPLFQMPSEALNFWLLVDDLLQGWQLIPSQLRFGLQIGIILFVVLGVVIVIARTLSGLTKREDSGE